MKKNSWLNGVTRDNLGNILEMALNTKAEIEKMGTKTNDRTQNTKRENIS